MSIFDFFYKKKDTSTIASIGFTDTAMSVIFKDGAKFSCRLDEINVVKAQVVRNQEKSTSIFLHISTFDKKELKIERGTEGYKKLRRFISQFQGFSYQNYQQALSCHDSQIFLLWSNPQKPIEKIVPISKSNAS